MLHITKEQLLSNFELFFSSKLNELQRLKLIQKITTEVFTEVEFPVTLNSEEQFILLLTYLPHVLPDFYDKLILTVFPDGGEMIEFGGVRGTQFRGFMPTVETALYFLCGENIELKYHYRNLFNQESNLFRYSILSVEDQKTNEPFSSMKLILAPDIEQYFISGEMPKPNFSAEFPAKLISTNMDWEDVVLHKGTENLIEDIKIWHQYHLEIYKDKNLNRKIKQGYKALFHGPSGTGKTLTAMLLGKLFNKEIYRIDLSQIVSKYIGETEKNLERIFKRAENTNWILFFDEADALFGKRSGVQSSHDKYANQEVSYLLQRIEDFTGLIILASNFKSNIDSAFVRRFNSIIHFPLPDANYRNLLWKKAEPDSIKYDSAIDWMEVSNKYELTGASIMNVVHYAALKSLSQHRNNIQVSDIIEGVRKELQKEDKFVRD